MESFRNFMQGRYGFDKLGLFIIIASIVLSMLSRLFWLPLLNWMAIILDIVFIYRFLSKKEFARQRENRIFLEKFEQAKRYIEQQCKKYGIKMDADAIQVAIENAWKALGLDKKEEAA